MKKQLFTPTKMFMVVITVFFFTLIFSCETEPPAESAVLDAKVKVDESSKSRHNVVEVTTTHMNLEVQSEIPSGWTTFKYMNESEHAPHFFVIEKMPEGKTYRDSQREIVPLFQDAMNYIVEGNVEMINETFAALGSIEWYKNLVFMGGPGLISPGHTAESTVYLEPGTYTIECYVKDENNVFHVTMGMISGFTVTGNANGQAEPKATMEVSISSAEGITFDEKIRPGKQVIKVLFKDQATYSHALGHDIHLVKLEGNADLNELNNWMNWSSPAGFLTPVPEGVTFLGGLQELPAKEGSYTSQVGFFKTRLEPGTYGFIAEVPDPMSKGMLKTFTVPGTK